MVLVPFILQFNRDMGRSPLPHSERAVWEGGPDDDAWDDHTSAKDVSRSTYPAPALRVLMGDGGQCLVAPCCRLLYNRMSHMLLTQR